MAARYLVSGQYTQAKIYSVEAILAQTHSRNILRKDSDPILWYLYELAVRLAQRLGYHRNPQSAKLNVTPFDPNEFDGRFIFDEDCVELPLR